MLKPNVFAVLMFTTNSTFAKRSKRGRDPLANLARDFVIVQAVESVSERYGLNPTRSPATSTESGSSIVALALEDSGADVGGERCRNLGQESSARVGCRACNTGKWPRTDRH